MKGLIRKILKEESLKQNLKDQVKEFGWKSTVGLVNGDKNLLKLMHINNPMDFLSLYDNLEVVGSKDFITFHRKKENEELMLYYKSHKDLYINYDQIWVVLDVYFNLSYYEIGSLIEDWLDKVYNLKGVRSVDSMEF